MIKNKKGILNLLLVVGLLAFFYFAGHYVIWGSFLSTCDVHEFATPIPEKLRNVQIKVEEGGAQIMVLPQEVCPAKTGSIIRKITDRDLVQDYPERKIERLPAGMNLELQSVIITNVVGIASQFNGPPFSELILKDANGVTYKFNRVGCDKCLGYYKDGRRVGYLDYGFMTDTFFEEEEKID